MEKLLQGGGLRSQQPPMEGRTQIVAVAGHVFPWAFGVGPFPRILLQRHPPWIDLDAQ